VVAGAERRANETAGRCRATRLDRREDQVVSALREDRAIESFWIGRENVLTLPDVDIMDSTDDEDDSAG